MADTVMVKKSFLKKLIERGKQAAPVIIERTRQVRRSTANLVKRGVSATRNELATDENGLFSAGLGGLVAYVMSLDAIKKSDFLKKHWYAGPLVMIGIGYWMVRRKKPYGKALMTLGGLLFVQAYQNRPKDADKKETPDKKETAGPDGQPYQLATPYGAQWVVTADGRQILMPARQPQHYEPIALPPRRETADPIAQTADEIYGRTA
jgi:hypothetical protein